MKSKESNSIKLVSYQKKDGRGPARPSFFWYDNDKDLKVCFLVTHLIYKNNIHTGWELEGNSRYHCGCVALSREKHKANSLLAKDWIWGA